jgi:hypothetical protein
VPTMRYLLKNDPKPAVRAAAAHTIAFFPNSAEESILVLQPIIFNASNDIPPELLGTSIIAYALLYAVCPSSEPNLQTVEERLRHYLASSDASLRWASATGLSRLGIVDAIVIQELVMTAISRVPPQTSFCMGESAEYAVKCLETVYAMPSLPDSIMKAGLVPILDGLSDPNLFCSHNLLPIACKILWKLPENSPFQKDNPVPFDELPREEEKRLLKSLAQIPHWTWIYLKETLRLWSLPPDRDACRHYVGLPEEGPYKDIILN